MPVPCQRLLDALRDLCPPRLALEGDPTGLQLGDPARPVGRVLCALDLTAAVAEEARARGAELVVSHHAAIFRPLAALREDEARGRLLCALIRAGTMVYVPHTALDVVEGGTNDWLAQAVGLQQVRVLDVTQREATPPRGIGRVGELPGPVTVRALAAALKARTGAPVVRVAAPDLEAPVTRAAVLAGDGRRWIGKAAAAGAQALITGEADHHSGLQARELGLALIDLGHWGSEKQATALLAAGLRERLAGEPVEVLESALETQPFAWV